MDSQPETSPLRRRDLHRDPTEPAAVAAPAEPAADPDAAAPADPTAAPPAAEPVAAVRADAPAVAEHEDDPAVAEREDAQTSGAEASAAGTSHGAGPAAPPERRRHLLALLLSLTAVIAVVDQVTKYLAESRLEVGELVPVLGDVLGLQLVYNPGAAFSFATGMTWVFTVIMVIVTVVVLRVSRRLGSLGWALALGMLLGGCLGNLYDRLFREPGFAVGHVVDFISYNGWFVGNVADIAIVGAAILIAVLALRGREIDGSLASDAGSDGAGRPAAGEDADD